MASETPSPGSVQEEGLIERTPEASPSEKDMEVDETNEAESASCPFNDSNDCFSTSSEIRQRLGPLSNPRFILPNNGWLKWVGFDLRHFPSAILMSGYTFILPSREDTIVNTPSGHFAVYRLAFDVGLIFPLHPLLAESFIITISAITN